MSTKVIPTLTIGNKSWYKDIFIMYDSLGINNVRINLTRFSMERYLEELLVEKHSIPIKKRRKKAM